MKIKKVDFESSGHAYTWADLLTKGDFKGFATKEHQKGSSFYVTDVISIDENRFPNLDKGYYGLWETNVYVWDADLGYDSEDIYELTRVFMVDKTVTITFFEEG